MWGERDNDDKKESFVGVTTQLITASDRRFPEPWLAISISRLAMAAPEPMTHG
jgi:hypothetical protein